MATIKEPPELSEPVCPTYPDGPWVEKDRYDVRVNSLWHQVLVYIYTHGWTGTNTLESNLDLSDYSQNYSNQILTKLYDKDCLVRRSAPHPTGHDWPYKEYQITDEGKEVLRRAKLRKAIQLRANHG